MSSTETDFETYARDCVSLAQEPDATPELREQLLQMAREWMKVAMDREDEGDACLLRSRVKQHEGDHGSNTSP